VPAGLCPQGCAAGACQTGFVPDPETGPVVQRIYTAYVAGKGFQAIAKTLNQEEIISPGKWGALRSGNPDRIARTATTTWTAGSVIDIADAGFAAGLITHNGRWYPGAHEPLITQETWDAYQRRREAQRRVPTKARSPKWSLARIAVCGQCGGPMYCTSNHRGEQYALYCGTQRTSGVCTGTYGTRQPVGAAVALWLGQYAEQLEQATRAALAQQPAQPADPHKAEKRRLTRLRDSAEVRLSRLLDGYTAGAPGLNLAEYTRRCALIEQETATARARLADLDREPDRAPTAATVAGFAEAWSTLGVDARRDVVAALLTAVKVHPDKSVVLVPRWGDPVRVTFTRHGTLPLLTTDASPDAERASSAAGPQKVSSIAGQHMAGTCTSRRWGGTLQRAVSARLALRGYVRTAD
jgi:site-specific DNA recombinase